MSFDIDMLRDAVALHGAVARVIVAGTAGSTPRAPGAAMLVWAEGQSGTIGGGTLEFEAGRHARARLATGAAAPELTRHPLGPALGQCCGGAVTLVTEVLDAARLTALAEISAARGCVLRAVQPDAAEAPPLALRRLADRARARGVAPTPQLLDGWFIEPLSNPRRLLWIWGAGHVGRALVATLAPLPDFAITWADTAAARFPAAIPGGVTKVTAQNPADLVAYAPAGAEHLIVTYSHALDLELCHRLLNHGFAAAGLIGSATKWARFRNRLSRLGHPPERIARIACPIGEPALGKHPQAIAVGVAAALLRDRKSDRTATDVPANTEAREARK